MKKTGVKTGIVIFLLVSAIMLSLPMFQIKEVNEFFLKITGKAVAGSGAEDGSDGVVGSASWEGRGAERTGRAKDVQDNGREVRMRMGVGETRKFSISDNERKIEVLEVNEGNAKVKVGDEVITINKGENGVFSGLRVTVSEITKGNSGHEAVLYVGELRSLGPFCIDNDAYVYNLNTYKIIWFGMSKDFVIFSNKKVSFQVGFKLYDIIVTNFEKKNIEFTIYEKSSFYSDKKETVVKFKGLNPAPMRLGDIEIALIPNEYTDAVFFRVTSHAGPEPSTSIDRFADFKEQAKISSDVRYRLSGESKISVIKDECYIQKNVSVSGSGNKLVNKVNEGYCDGNQFKIAVVECSPGLICNEGVCVNGEIDIELKTTKDTYLSGEKILLTSGDEKAETRAITGSVVREEEEKTEEIGVEEESLSISDGILDDPYFKAGEDEGSEEAGGYIIEFTETPEIELYAQLKKIGINEGRRDAALQSYSESLQISHDRTKGMVFERLGAKRYEPGIVARVIALITGRAIEKDPKKEIEVLGEYTNVFNGIALNISKDEAEKLRNVKGVKSIEPNKKVKAFMQDSLPLVGATEAWKLDDDLGDCKNTGKKCLTGKGIKVAVIDTGVDFQHPDLNNLYSNNPKLSIGFPKLLENEESIYPTQDGKYSVFKNSWGRTYMYDADADDKILVPEEIPGTSKIIWADDKRIIYYEIIEGSTGSNEYRYYIFDRISFKKSVINSWGEDSGYISDVIVKYPYFAFRNKENNMGILNLENGMLKYFGKAEHQGVTPLFIDKNRILYGYYTEESKRNFWKLDIYNMRDRIVEDNSGITLSGITLEAIYSYTGGRLVFFAQPNEVRVYSFSDQTEETIGYLPATPVKFYADQQGAYYYTVRGEGAEEGKEILYMLGSDTGGKKVYEITKDVEWFMPYSKGGILFKVKGIGDLYYLDNYIIWNILKGSETKVIDGGSFVHGVTSSQDDHGHGTHVASIIAGKGDYNKNGLYEPELGEVWGVAPDAQIIAYKALNMEGGGRIDNIISALEKAADPNGDRNYDDAPDIISMSLGGDCTGFYGRYTEDCGPGDSYSGIMERISDAGIITVVAAGNSGPGVYTIASPALSEDVITVGAVYKKDSEKNVQYDTMPKKEQVVFFSSRGPVITKDKVIMKPDIVAPGAFICAAGKFLADGKGGDKADEARCPSLKDDKFHVALSGTSMATPVVSGAIALLKEAHPELNPEQIKMLLMQTSDDVGDNPTAVGAGMLNIAKALSIREPLSFIDEGSAIESPGIIWETYNIKGRIKSEDFSAYTIEIAYLNPVSSNTLDYKLIFESRIVPDSEYIASNIKDPDAYGSYILKLKVLFNSGKESVRYAYLLKKEGGISRFGGWAEPITSNSGNKINTRIGSQIIADIENDGKKEILAADNKKVYVYDAVTAKLKNGWPQNYLDYYWMTEENPAVGDLDGDGKQEVVILDVSNLLNAEGKLCGYGWHSDGTPIDGWDNKCKERPPTNSFTPLGDFVLYDMDGDGKQEIITVAQNPENPEIVRVYVLNGDGSVREGWPVEIILIDKREGYSMTGYPSSPSVGDINGDGKPEIVVIGNTPSAITLSCEEGIGWAYIFDADGNMKINFRTACPSSISAPILADIDGDGTKEIGFKSGSRDEYNGVLSKGLVFYENNGKLIENSIITDSSFLSESRNYNSPIASDLDGDGKPEIILSAVLDDRKFVPEVEMFNTGNPEKSWKRDVFGSPFVNRHQTADIDGDGKLEVIATTSRGLIYAFNSNGDVLPGFPISVFDRIISAAALDDVDGDGNMEIFVSNGEKIYAFEILKTGKNSGEAGWPFYALDAQHSNCYGCEKNVDLESEEKPFGAPFKPDIKENTGKSRIINKGYKIMGNVQIKMEGALNDKKGLQWIKSRGLGKEIIIEDNDEISIAKMVEREGWIAGNPGKYRILVEFSYSKYESNKKSNKIYQVGKSYEFNVI